MYAPNPTAAADPNNLPAPELAKPTALLPRAWAPPNILLPRLAALPAIFPAPLFAPPSRPAAPEARSPSKEPPSSFPVVEDGALFCSVNCLGVEGASASLIALSSTS